MSAKLTLAEQSSHDVSEMILGQNIEMCLTTADGLLSDRLRNPKLLGPAHPVTGVAPEWQGASCGRSTYELVSGTGLKGKAAQFINSLTSYAYALHQNKVSVRAGETLECEIWARAWHAPVKLEVALLPLASRLPAYATGAITVDTSYFKRYVVTLSAPRDDDEARLAISVVAPGALWIDQVHLRPQGEPLLSRPVIDEMAAMRIPTLRFPGGIVVNAYHWQQSIGPVHLRPSAHDPAFRQDWYVNYDFGLDEYLTVCEQQNIAPTITFNVATGTPEGAAEMAAYCKTWFEKAGKPAPFIYWHVANHPYSWTTAHMNPAMYVDVVKSYVPGVKAVYPNSRIVAVMSSHELAADAEKAAWREGLFNDSEAAALIDVVAVQHYGSCNPEAEPATQINDLCGSLQNIETGLGIFIKMCRERKVKWNVGIAEWNMWLQASHWDGRAFEEPPTALHGLFIAGMIRRFAACAPDFEFACFYNLVNCMGILNRYNADVDVTDSVTIFKLYRDAVPGRFVPANLEGENIEGVEALALENKGGRWLFLTNNNFAKSAQVTLNAALPANAKIVSMAAAKTVGKFSTATIKVTGNTLELPPLSITRLHCK